MTALMSLTLGCENPEPTRALCQALGVADRVSAAHSDEPTTGFRGFSLSLVAPSRGHVDALLQVALDGGASVLQPASTSFWGYGAIVASPDGAIWKFASSSKKDTGEAVPEFDNLVVLLGVDDVKASKRFYISQGMHAGRSFGGKYAELGGTDGGLTLAVYPRKTAAKEVGADPAGSGSHRVVLGSDGPAFTDPDGFVWEPAGMTSER
ncbi:glyoxalase [Ruania alkalisoli]|uniref:Glyoxalase n=1 Tax=Ruania alkalisoli TaxID=2779775 RepID=A0A7M1SRX9_9MICO|nr:glyoxalase [Ruania alkalisoli]QOR69343.1 glyoxalase [Ruania alkalisoli]